MDEHRMLERVSSHALRNVGNFRWHQNWTTPWLPYGRYNNNNNVYTAAAEKVIRQYAAQYGPRIIVDPTLGRDDSRDAAPAYHPIYDVVKTLPRERFRSSEHYYNVLFHELTHSTGYRARLNRWECMHRDIAGATGGALEELTAEMGATLLTARHGTATEETLENNAKYMAGFLMEFSSLEQPQVLKLAEQQARKAAEFIENGRA